MPLQTAFNRTISLINVSKMLYIIICNIRYNFYNIKCNIIFWHISLLLLMFWKLYNIIPSSDLWYYGSFFKISKFKRETNISRPGPLFPWWTRTEEGRIGHRHRVCAHQRLWGAHISAVGGEQRLNPICAQTQCVFFCLLRRRTLSDLCEHED